MGELALMTTGGSSPRAAAEGGGSEGSVIVESGRDWQPASAITRGASARRDGFTPGIYGRLPETDEARARGAFGW